ncbi:hypothetical protein [Streptomyces canus]|uniref:hypothetical protein n=1 Tax=Streptomyces canus TaxID=58343 RepID=UPI0036E606BA
MIRVMVGSRALRRPAPSVLLIGLILLVASHLLGALHGPGFLGPHQPFAMASAPVSRATEQMASGPDHGHGHDVFDDAVEHAIDRVRVPVDRPFHAPQPAEPVVDRPRLHPFSGRADSRDGVPAPGGGRSVCARHCLWRQ